MLVGPLKAGPNIGVAVGALRFVDLLARAGIGVLREREAGDKETSGDSHTANALTTASALSIS